MLVVRNAFFISSRGAGGRPLGSGERPLCCVGSMLIARVVHMTVKMRGERENTGFCEIGF